MHLRVLQFVYERTLSQVLYSHVYCRDDITSVDRCNHRDIHVSVENLATMCKAFCTSQYGVISQLQSTAGSILGSKHISHRALCERSKRASARIKLLTMESTLIRRQFEHRQRLHLAVCVIVNALRPYRPVACLLLSSFLKVLPEFISTLGWEDFVESHADGVHLYSEQRVFLLSACHEIHVYLVFRNTACHELSVATEDISSVGLHAYAVTL